MFGVFPLTPAYGRDYTSAAQVLEDFNADKDFKTPSGRVTNRADLRELVASGRVHVSARGTLHIRYDKLRELVVVYLDTEGNAQNYAKMKKHQAGEDSSWVSVCTCGSWPDMTHGPSNRAHEPTCGLMTEG